MGMHLLQACILFSAHFLDFRQFCSIYTKEKTQHKYYLPILCRGSLIGFNGGGLHLTTAFALLSGRSTCITVCHTHFPTKNQIRFFYKGCYSWTPRKKPSTQRIHIWELFLRIKSWALHRTTRRHHFLPQLQECSDVISHPGMWLDIKSTATDWWTHLSDHCTLLSASFFSTC